MVGKLHAFVPVRDWLGQQKPVDREVALVELDSFRLARLQYFPSLVWVPG
jgi:hypothetical protein